MSECFYLVTFSFNYIFGRFDSSDSETFKVKLLLKLEMCCWTLNFAARPCCTWSLGVCVCICVCGGVSMATAAIINGIDRRGPQRRAGADVCLWTAGGRVSTHHKTHTRHNTQPKVCQLLGRHGSCHFLLLPDQGQVYSSVSGYYRLTGRFQVWILQPSSLRFVLVQNPLIQDGRHS